jgi:hypothetical protein
VRLYSRPFTRLLVSYRKKHWPTLGLAAVTKDTSPLSLIYKKMAAEEAYGPMGYTYLGNGQFVPHDQAPAGEASSYDCGTQTFLMSWISPPSFPRSIRCGQPRLLDVSIPFARWPRFSIELYGTIGRH